MYQSIPQTPSNKRVFGACLLSFAILITPIAALAAPRSGGRPTVKQNSVPPNKTESSAREAFINPSAPAPVAPTITATMVDSLENDDGDGKIDPTNGVPATTERIVYTATISNTGGAGATGLQFSD